MSDQKFEQLLNRLESLVNRLEKVGISGGSGGDDVTSSEAVEKYDEFYKEHITPFLDTSNKIGGDVKEASQLVDAAFKETRSAIEKASQSKKPTNEDQLREFLKPVSSALVAVGDFRAKKRQSPFYNHLTSLSEGISALGWLAVDNTPVTHIKDSVPSFEFYTNKIRVEFKNKDGGQLHIDWVVAFKNSILKLADYVKEYHLTGLKWNPQGGDVSSAKSSTPKVEPKPQPQSKPVQQAKQDQPSKAALFSSISSIDTKKLQHVTKDMKTKNQPKQSSVEATSTNKPVSTSKPVSKKRITGTPVHELQNEQKWIVENHDGNKNLIITVEEIKHTVYIYKCDNCSIQVKGKCNTITIDDSRKTVVVFENLLAQCEIVNSKDIKVQALGRVPTITIDKTDGGQVYLSNESLDTSIVTSKSSELNILIPDGDEGDFTEHPVAEQFVTKFNPKTKKLVTELSAHV